MRKLTQAFTLIELLIVVAIIAILAAIAVPNFLEAQTRAKVSRCRADMRSIATAVEAYSVDFTKYPLNMLHDQNTGVEADPWGGNPPVSSLPAPSTNEFYFSRTNSITTPVSYLTSIPYDAFFRIVPNLARSGAMIRREYQWSNSLYGSVNANTIANFQKVYGSWRIWSGGPDGDRRDILLRTPRTEAMRIYDPTNGTVSKGDIWRTHRNPEGTRPTIPGITE